MLHTQLYLGDRQAEFAPHAQLRTQFSPTRVLTSAALFLILCTTFYAFGDLNNPGFTIVIELDDASPAALALLKRTLQCIYDSRRVSPTSLEIVVFCACSEPDNPAVLGDLRFKAALEAGGQPHSPYFPITFLWDFPLSYMAVTVKAVTYKYMAFLPPDVCVDPDWAITLIRKLAWRQAEVVGSRVLAEDGTLEHAGVEYQMAPSSMREVPQPAFYLRGLSGNDSRALADRPAVSLSRVGMGVTKVVFVMQRAFNETLAPHYDALDFTLGVRARGGRVVYCGACVVRRLSGSESKLMEYHKAREPPTPQWALFLSLWAASLERTIRRAYQSDWAVLVSAPLSPRTGLPSEALVLLMELQAHVEVKLRVNSNPQGSLDLQRFQYPDWVEETLVRLNDRTLHARKPFVHLILCDSDGGVAPWYGSDAYRIQRCSFDSDATLAQWAESLKSHTHELWVPSLWHEKHCHLYGLQPARAVRVLPPAIDVHVWDPATASQAEARAALRVPWTTWAAFTFLSVLRWDDSKGWRSLVQAMVEEFNCCPTHTCADVALILKVDPSGDTEGPVDGASVAAVQQALWDEARRHVPRDCKAPRIDLLTDFLPFRQMLLLYRAVNAYVLPSQSEKWGRTYLEAMAMGLPTLVTAWGAALELLGHNNSFLLEVDTANRTVYRTKPVPPGEVRKWLATVYTNAPAAAVTGAIARATVTHCCAAGTAGQFVLARLRDIAHSRAPAPSPR